MDFDHRVPKVLINKTAGGVCDRHDWCQKKSYRKNDNKKEMS